LAWSLCWWHKRSDVAIHRRADFLEKGKTQPSNIYVQQQIKYKIATLVFMATGCIPGACLSRPVSLMFVITVAG